MISVTIVRDELSVFGNLCFNDHSDVGVDHVESRDHLASSVSAFSFWRVNVLCDGTFLPLGGLDPLFA